MSSTPAPKNELLLYLSNYYCVGVLYSAKTSSTPKKIKLLPLCFVRNLPNLWEDIVKEFSDHFKVSVFSKISLSVQNISSDLENLLPKEVRDQKILVRDAIANSDFPLVPLEVEENADIKEIVKWFPYNENSENVENAIANRVIFGPAGFSSEWERSIENSLLRQVIKTSIKGVGEKIKKYEELYFSGSALFGCDNYLDIMLAIMDSIDASGLWTIYVDRESALIAALPKIEKAGLTPLCHLFVTQEVGKVNVVFDDENKHLLNLQKQSICAIPVAEKKSIKISMNLKKGLFERSFSGSKYGVVFDTRARPLEYAQIKSERLKNADEMRKQLGMF